jgi:hypothetical protein
VRLLSLTKKVRKKEKSDVCREIPNYAHYADHVCLMDSLRTSETIYHFVPQRQVSGMAPANGIGRADGKIFQCVKPERTVSASKPERTVSASKQKKNVVSRK